MALRDSTTVNAGTNGGTVSAPAGLAQNDIVLLRVLLAGYNNLAITWPAGFTQIGNTSCDASVAADVRTHKVAWARMGASPPANFAVSWTGNDASTIHCAAFSGRSTTSDPAAFETQPGAGTTSRPLSLAATGGTMVAGDDVAWFTDVFGGGDAGTFTPPTDYTAQETSTNLYAIGQLATRNNVAAGSTTPITGSWTGPAAQAYSWGAVVVRIPVASSGPTGSGALQAQAATVSGTATVTSGVDVSASGALQAQAAAVSGVAVDFQVVTGSSIVTDNTSLFFNLNFTPIDGDKVGIPRNWLGSAIGLSADGRFTVTPALPDETVIPRISYDASTTTWYQDNVTLADNGSLTIYASGALQAQAAAVSGVAFVPGMITASGALQSLAAVVAGSASIVIPIPPATGDQSRGHYRYQGMGTFRGRSFS